MSTTTLESTTSQQQPASIVAAIPARMLGGIRVCNTKDLLSLDTRFAVLIEAPAKFGKTTMAATIDRLSKEQLGKPAMFVSLESSDGGGTMSIRGLGVDYVIPQNYAEMEKLIEPLIESQDFGAVVIDSATEYVNQFLKPYALKFPSKEKTMTREAGVPERSDYQTMGEKMRSDFNRLLKMTRHPDLRKRKHLIITALEKERTDDRGNLVAIVPDMPGAMANAATAMFQTVGSIKITTTVEKDAVGKPTRVTTRGFNTSGDGVRVAGDRMGVLPAICEPDLHTIWYKYIVPAITG